MFSFYFYQLWRLFAAKRKCDLNYLISAFESSRSSAIFLSASSANSRFPSLPLPLSLSLSL